MKLAVETARPATRSWGLVPREHPRCPARNELGLQCDLPSGHYREHHVCYQEDWESPRNHIVNGGSTSKNKCRREKQSLWGSAASQTRR